MNLFGAGKTSRPERDEWAYADGGNRESEQTAADTEDGAFCEALADEASTICTESDAHGEFAFAGNGAREEQTRDIDAGDQQDEADRREQEPQS
jgi:hypothetical protein